jgi:hypothetical protein
LSTLGLIGLFANLLAASLLRADPGPIWQGWRVDTWMAAGCLAISLGALLVSTAASLRKGLHRRLFKQQTVDESS